MPKVSVIVPVYKAEKSLDRCVRSLLSQTLRDIEVILVDDGSPDGCPALCDGFARGDGRVRVLHKENGGVSAARNDGLSAASGEYVLFCDSDDWMEENALELLSAEAERTGADVVIGDVFLVTGENRREVHFFKEPFVSSDRGTIAGLLRADLYRAYCPDPPEEGPAFGYGGPWNKLVRKKLLDGAGIRFDLSLRGVFDDIIYTAHILCAAGTVAYIRRPVYDYVQVSSSVTHSFQPAAREISRAVFACWDDVIRNRAPAGDYEKPFLACVIRRAEESVRLYFAHPANPKPLRERARELREMMRTEPYRTALARAELKKLTRKQQAVAYLCRFRLYGPLLRLFGRR